MMTEKYAYMLMTQKVDKKAMDMILDIAKIIEVGGIYNGKVTRIMPFRSIC